MMMPHSSPLPYRAAMSVVPADTGACATTDDSKEDDDDDETSMRRRRKSSCRSTTFLLSLKFMRSKRRRPDSLPYSRPTAVPCTAVLAAVGFFLSGSGWENGAPGEKEKKRKKEGGGERRKGGKGGEEGKRRRGRKERKRKEERRKGRVEKKEKGGGGRGRERRKIWGKREKEEGRCRFATPFRSPSATAGVSGRRRRNGGS